MPISAYVEADVPQDGVSKLLKVVADLGVIATSKIPTVRGADGELHYKVSYQIQIIFNSGDTVYELIHDNINYGRVSAEYI